jgi:CYTH domain-containing protein
MAEIERKWLVNDPPADLTELPSREIDQGYVAIDADGTEVRVRRVDGDAVMTIKQGAGRTRAEEEFAIPADRFERLWPLTASRRLHKRRYVIPGPDGLTFELDRYGGDLEGLAVVEVEFPDDHGADAFEVPAWFGREVTDDARYKNQALARTHATPDQDS